MTTIFIGVSVRAAGLTDKHVPYRGTALAMQDLVAGQNDLSFPDAGSSVPQIRAGTIKSFAVMANSRLPAALDIPTSDEAGLPGFHDATVARTSWGWGARHGLQSRDRASDVPAWPFTVGSLIQLKAIDGVGVAFRRHLGTRGLSMLPLGRALRNAQLGVK